MLSPQQLEDIERLQKKCEKADQISLKLNWDMLQNRDSLVKNDFFHYDGQELIGFLGLYGFGHKVEICGMVAPKYRRKGIFSHLFDAAIQEVKVQNITQILLNTPSNSSSGKGFLQGISCAYSFSEYQMKWNGEDFELSDEGINIRPVTLLDEELEVQLDVQCFGLAESEARQFNHVVKEDTTQKQYMIEFGEKTVGKIRVSQLNQEAWIYGFAVLPDFQGKGIGRCALKQIVQKESNAGFPVFLEVEAKNAHALKLYESCGFVSFNTQDYYKFSGL
ncbi:GNAT family N-acetyltransferase [Bacillus carboniphilus]|uniref:GNAT family N-acetyltransferase n=1 Tax=Bacillus carboniphilus TaxID=86663 RepID=A0ABN0W752_9BACI